MTPLPPSPFLALRVISLKPAQQHDAHVRTRLDHALMMGRVAARDQLQASHQRKGKLRKAKRS